MRTNRSHCGPSVHIVDQLVDSDDHVVLSHSLLNHWVANIDFCNGCSTLQTHGSHCEPRVHNDHIEVHTGNSLVLNELVINQSVLIVNLST